VLPVPAAPVVPAVPVLLPAAPVVPAALPAVPVDPAAPLAGASEAFVNEQ